MLKYVNLEGNPLSLYPERCRNSWSKMKEYLQKLTKRSNDGIFRKVVIVGDRGSEKTSFFTELEKKYFKSTAEYVNKGNINTAQITISDDQSNSEFILNVWDMGKEESKIQNFFITSHGIYILCFDPSKENYLSSICFWLQLIQSLCKASQSNPAANEFITPVFLVASTNEEISNHKLEIIEEQILDQINTILFRGFRGLYNVCFEKSGKGLKNLIDDMTKFIKLQVGARMGISENWVLLNDCLHRMKRNNNKCYLDWSSYEELTKKCKITKSVLQSCTTFLRDIGTLLLYFNASNFSDNKSIIILNPHWLSNLLFFILNDDKYISNGFISIDDYNELLSQYSPLIRDFTVSLLIQYNALHRFSPTTYLLPPIVRQPCPLKELRNLWPNYQQDSVIEHQRIFEFSFLPVEFFSRVIVRILGIRGIKGTLFWKNGALFEFFSQNSLQQCKLTYDEKNYRLFIYIRILSKSDCSEFQKSKGCGMLFRHVIDVVRVLMESFYPRLIEASRCLVPCTHCILHSAIDPYIFSNTDCIAAITAGKRHLFCNNIESSSRRVSLAHLAPDISLIDLMQVDENVLQINHIVGQGSFGDVYNGFLNDIPVAIKTLKLGIGMDGVTTQQCFWEFQQESYIMRFV